MKTAAQTRQPKSLAVDILAPDAAEQFRRAAAAYEQKILDALDPKQAALERRLREGIWTKTGRLTKRYR